MRLRLNAREQMEIHLFLLVESFRAGNTTTFENPVLLSSKAQVLQMDCSVEGQSWFFQKGFTMVAIFALVFGAEEHSKVSLHKSNKSITYWDKGRN